MVVMPSLPSEDSIAGAGKAHGEYARLYSTTPTRDVGVLPFPMKTYTPDVTYQNRKAFWGDRRGPGAGLLTRLPQSEM